MNKQRTVALYQQFLMTLISLQRVTGITLGVWGSQVRILSPRPSFRNKAIIRGMIAGKDTAAKVC
jgi:hypothetical protein